MCKDNNSNTQQALLPQYHVSKNVRFLERELKTAYDSPVRSSIDVVIWELCATAMQNIDIQTGALVLVYTYILLSLINETAKATNWIRQRQPLQSGDIEVVHQARSRD